MKPEEKYGYWYVGTNRWSSNKFTKEQAEKYSDTLVNCTGCTDCTGCTGCTRCTDCTDCTGCTRCRGCTGCRGCTDCTEFKSNPQRITSPKIGSRQSQSTYYWTDEHEQVVCGCFCGTLDEFAERVKNVHGDNQHGQEYIKWIKAVKCYKEGSK